MEDGARPPMKESYHLSRPKMVELKEQLMDLVETNYLRMSKSPYATLVLFQRKEGKIWLCVDYKELNKLIIKNKYPLPLIVDSFDHLVDARVFSKLDLRQGYH